MIFDKDTKLKDITNISDLADFLCWKGERHHYFSKYVNFNKEYFKTSTPTIMFSSGTEWEDKNDRENMNRNDGFIYFSCCMTYLTDENIAMWKLYGNWNGVLLRFSNTYIKKCLNWKSNNGFDVYKKLPAVSNEDKIHIDYVKIQDVIYYGKGETDNELYICRPDSSAQWNYKENKDIRDYQEIISKRAGWRFESEVRITIRIPKEKSANIKHLYLICPKPSDEKEFEIRKQPSFITDGLLTKKNFGYLLDKVEKLAELCGIKQNDVKVSQYQD